MINNCPICGKELDGDGSWCNECEATSPIAGLYGVEDMTIDAAEWAAKRARDVAEEKYKTLEAVYQDLVEATREWMV